MSTDDQQLVAAFSRNRDEAAFLQLYRRHTPVLYALACRLAGTPAGAEELTQQAWVRAVERHDRFEGRSQYRTWLTGILINCFRESLRHNARQGHSFDERRDHEHSETVAPFPAPARAAETLDIDRALSQLPPGYREVVILHDINGYTHAEIASLLEISAGTSKSQLNRGRARLRALLRPESKPGTHKRGTS